MKKAIQITDEVKPLELKLPSAMKAKDLKHGDVVMMPVWYSPDRKPALVWEKTENGAYVSFIGGANGEVNRWYSHWCAEHDMRKADAKTQASMKMIRGKTRDDFFGSYRYMVLCAAPLGMSDTIVAGCRRWTSFRDAFNYYTHIGRGDQYNQRKATVSKAILMDLQKKYDRELARQNRR